MRVIAVATLVLSGVPAAAKEGASKQASMLTASDLDPKAVLPAPPAKDSIQARAELAELHAMESARSDAELASARFDGATTNASVFAEVFGPKFDMEALPATANLLAIVRATEKEVVDHGKDEFLRERPWIVDPALKTCERGNKPLSSYPSGHASMAFSMASILVRLVPEKAEPLLARAARYAQSRIVCEQHFRSDVTAGEALGILIADRLMAKSGFRIAFDAARAELVHAGIAR